MTSSKSSRKNRDAKLLDEIKKLRGEIKNHDAKVLGEVKRVSDETKNRNTKLLNVVNEAINEIKKEKSNRMIRDIGGVTLVYGIFLVTLSISFVFIGFENFTRVVHTGFSFIFSGTIFIFASFMPPQKLKIRYFFVFVGFVLLILGAIILFIR